MTKKGEAITSLEKIFPEAADLPDTLPLHSALSLLADYAKSKVFAEEFEKRLQDNFGADADWKNLNEKDKLLFIERFIFDSKTGRWGKSPALIFAESAQGLSDRLRAEFLALSTAMLDYYEFIQFGSNCVIIKDLISENVFEISGENFGSGIGEGDIILARLAPWNGKLHFTSYIGKFAEKASPLATVIRKTKLETTKEDWERAMRKGNNIQPSLPLFFETTFKSDLLQSKAARMKGHQLLAEAEIQMKRENYVEAQLYLDEYLTRQPKDKDALLSMSKVMLKTGRQPQALKILRSLADEHPDDIEVLCIYAGLLFAAGSSAESYEYYSRSLKLNPPSKRRFQILNSIGVIAASMGKRKEGLAAFRSAAEIAEDDTNQQEQLIVNVLEAEETRLGIKLAKRLSVLAPTSDSYTILSRAYSARSKWGAAAKAIGKAIQLAPERIELFSDLGNLHFKNGNIEKAISAYEFYLTVFPGDIRALNNLGVAYRNANKLEDAERIFRKTLQLSPQYIPAMLNLAKLCIEQGNLAEARKHLEKAVCMGESSPVADELMQILEGEEHRKQISRKK